MLTVITVFHGLDQTVLQRECGMGNTSGGLGIGHVVDEELVMNLEEAWAPCAEVVTLSE